MALDVVLSPGTELTAAGLRLAGAVTAVADPWLVTALARGLPVADALASAAAASELDRLHRRCLLAWRLDGVAEAMPLVPGLPLPVALARAAPAAGGPTGPMPLSRFALLRRESGAWLLESGRSSWRVVLTGRGVAGLGDLAALGADAGPLLALLGAAGMLADGDDDPSARGWTHPDRWFAARSRRDLGLVPAFGTGARDEPEPAVRQDLPDGPRVPLPVPAGPGPDEPSLWEASESRRSVRSHADAPVPLAALAELLWRTLRVVQVRPQDPADPQSYEAMWRPVGSGGAMHGTELWLACPAVEGLDPGIYRYDPVTHELVTVAPADDRMDRLVAGIARGTGGRLGAVGLITARHARAAWKYGGGLAYALELKDVGVMMHALQLTAAAVGLGMCPIGSGPTASVGRALGVDPEVDTPVGEFLLGVAPGRHAPTSSRFRATVLPGPPTTTQPGSA